MFTDTVTEYSPDALFRSNDGTLSVSKKPTGRRYSIRELPRSPLSPIYSLPIELHHRIIDRFDEDPTLQPSCHSALIAYSSVNKFLRSAFLSRVFCDISSASPHGRKLMEAVAKRDERAVEIAEKYVKNVTIIGVKPFGEDDGDSVEWCIGVGVGFAALGSMTNVQSLTVQWVHLSLDIMRIVLSLRSLRSLSLVDVLSVAPAPHTMAAANTSPSSSPIPHFGILSHLKSFTFTWKKYFPHRFNNAGFQLFPHHHPARALQTSQNHLLHFFGNLNLANVEKLYLRPRSEGFVRQLFEVCRNFETDEGWMAVQALDVDEEISMHTLFHLPFYALLKLERLSIEVKLNGQEWKASYGDAPLELHPRQMERLTHVRIHDELAFLFEECSGITEMSPPQRDTSYKPRLERLGDERRMVLIFQQI
jgi:hypothetical protein